MRVLSHTLHLMLLGLMLLVGCNTQNKEQGNFSVIEFSPTEGPRSGGILLTLTGDDLQFTNQVTVGGKICTSLVIASPTTLTCMLPANPAGEATIVVRNLANNFRTAEEKFVYVGGARIDSITPLIGPTTGGQILTLSGEAFSTGSIVRVGGAICGPTVINGDRTQITCTTTARSAGDNLAVTVLDLNGDTATLENAYSYVTRPTITAVSPSFGPLIGGGSVTLTGFSFPTNPAQATVLVGGSACSITAISAVSITCTLPPGTAGSKEVRVDNLVNGQFGVRSGGYTYMGPPTIVSVLPANGPLIGGQTLTVTGTNFFTGMTVSVGAVPCTSVTVTNSTSLTCVTGARASGLVGATVTNSFGDAATLSDAYNYRAPPSFVSVTPTQIVSKDDANDDTIAITVNSAYTLTPGDLRVFVNGQSCTGVSLVGSVITCNPPDLFPNPLLPQLVSIQIINPDNQTVTQSNAITFIPAPTVTSVVQNSGPLNALNTIVVNGYGFTADTVIKVIRPGPIEVDCAVTAQSTTQITCDLAAAGLVGPAAVVANVQAQNPLPLLQTTLFNNGYTFRPAPVLTATNPVSGSPNGLFYDIVIVGENFFEGDFLKASVNGIDCDSTEWISATQIKCNKVPADISGGPFPISFPISVINGDGQVSTGAVNFTYKLLPTIISVANNQGPAYETTLPLITRQTLQITGSDFDAAGFVKVYVAGVECVIDPLDPINTDSFIECQVPNYSTPAIPLPFLALIEVVNTDGQKSTQDMRYTYVNIPTIDSVNPSVGPTNAAMGSYPISITGSHFSDKAGFTLTLGGYPCENINVTANEITCTIPDVAVATGGDIVFTQPDGLIAVNSAPGFSFRNAPVLTDQDYYFSADIEDLIVIEGTEIYADSIVTLEQGTTILSCPVSSVSPTSVSCTKPAFPAGGVFDVRVVNVPSIPLEDVIVGRLNMINDPTITSILPFNRGMPGDMITLEGTNLIGGSLTVGGAACTAFNIHPSQTFMTCTLPAGSGLVNIVYTNEAGRTVTLPFTYIDPPTISSVTPAFGAVAGGSNIQVAGSGFIGTGWSVSIDGSDCAVTSISGGFINCTTSGHAAGEFNVVVSLTTNATATLTNGFRYLDPPTPTAVSVASLPQTDIGTSREVTVTTGGYLVGTPVVSFGGAACALISSDTQNITCTVAAHPSGGDVAVSITNGDGQTASASGLFTFTRAPTISSVSPSAGNITGGTAITVAGANILAGARVYLGSYDPMSPTTNECTSPVVNVGAQTISCVTPDLSAPAGVQTAVNVIVVNTDTQIGTRVNGFTYQPAPFISSVEPELFGPVTGGNQLTINGDYFYPGVLVTINGIICGPVIRDSVNRVRCNAAPAPGGVPGSFTLRVFNSDNQQATTTYNYVASPTVASFNRNMFLTSGFESLVINGTGFRTGVTVRIGALNCVVSSVTDTQIECETPIVLSEGTQTVTITNLNGQNIVLANALYFNAPLNLTFISPISGPAVGGNTISLTGTGFYAGMTITIGGVACNSINVTSTNLASCSPAGGAAGAQDVVVGLTSPVQTSTLSGAYTYREAPTIASISPTSGSTAGGTSVTITGTNFVTGSVAKFNGTNCTSISSLTGTSFTCLTPARSAGPVTVFVTNPDGQTTPTSVAYTYNPPPTLSSISPSFGAVSGGTSVTINGSNFVLGATASVGGVTCASTSFVNSTRLTCVTADLSTTGLKSVIVTNPDTQSVTLSNVFNALPAPTLSSVSPLSSLTTGGITVRFTGTNFLVGSIARIDGVNCSSTNYISSTALDCVVPSRAAAVGLSLSVLNPDNQSVVGADTFSYVDEARLEWVVGGVSPTPPNPDNYGSTSTNIMHTYTLRNVGTVSSGGVTVSIEGIQSFAYMIHTNNCGAVMAPAAQCTVSVNFLGSMLGSGSYTATLRATGAPGGTTDNVMQGSRP